MRCSVNYQVFSRYAEIFLALVSIMGLDKVVFATVLVRTGMSNHPGVSGRLNLLLKFHF